MALSSNWTPSVTIAREHENTPEPMTSGDLQGPWVDSPYSTHGRDMTHMLPQEWASPDTVSVQIKRYMHLRMGGQTANEIAGFWTSIRDNSAPKSGFIDANQSL